MPLVSFTKAVALGNDFVILDARYSPFSLTIDQIRILADRRQGVGCDQVIVLLPPTDLQADVRLRIYNNDGSDSGACGNGTRSVARLLMETEGKNEIFIETAGTICQAAWAQEKKGEEVGISVTLGIPRFDWDHIPLANPEALRDVSYNTIASFCVNVGNPHAVFFVGDVDEIPLASIGPQIENHRAFPERINVGFAEIVNKSTLRLRVWERGAGYTMACGTGACAAAVAAIHQKLVSSGQSPLRIIQEGGELLVDWREGHPITMIGPAHIKFHGEIFV
ncbi:MAG: diaminopimelate epimerase [Alphaproteobacteria bacterium]|jgi:diaminopimelate epimerase|nr:diaminopimelate epimerase [Alphaproteobacteria bacterium]